MGDANLTGTVLDGRYTVIEPIADGAMGSVYRGERLHLGRAVAIKVMHKELPDELASRQRFEREAKLMALLEHPNCVSVIDFGLHDDKPFLVMDLVRGTSLLQELEKVGKIEMGRAADIVRQVLSGLSHAHELGIVHRDIKPANIMISEKAGFGQQVRILDFGLARLTESSTKLTTGIVVGTPNYMAPEQCKGSDIDARTDVYACGVMLFEMLTGRKPFIADDPIAVVRKHLLEKPPTLAAIEPGIDFGPFEAVVAKALSKPPADRYASAADMAKALEDAAQAVKTSAAAIYARAVPDGAPTLGTQQATMSGWTVPQDGRAGAPATSAAVEASGAPAPTSGPTSGPTMGVANVGNTSGPFTGVAQVADGGSGPTGPAGGFRPSSGPVDSAGYVMTTEMQLPVADRKLPALPQAAPYVPPAPPPPVIGAPNPVTIPVDFRPPPASTSSGAPNASASSGAPSAALDVPPTRPTTAPPTPVTPAGARPIPQLPLTKKQLMIGGGGVLALIILIAIIAGGGGDKKPSKKPSTGSGSSVVQKDPPPAEGPAQIIADAKNLLASEDYDSAADLLRTARKTYPNDAEVAYLAGRAYFGRLYWADGIESFRAAIDLEPKYKEDPDLLKTVLKGFLTTPDVDDRIASFMRWIGPPMRPFLEETAEKHPKKNLRARARAELNARP